MSKIKVEKISSEEEREAFTLGYCAATNDIVTKLVDMPKEHGGKILFQRDVYSEEFKEFVNPKEIMKRIEEYKKIIK